MDISLPAIILHSPQMGENIGAAARVMYNFGFTDLRLVSPRDGWPNPKAEEMAAGAKIIVDNAKIFPNLSEAIADLSYVYATTARPRNMDKIAISPREVEVFAKTGVVFGAERTGLENEDISLCDKIITIPVSPQYKSLNLAQTVAVMCYELAQIIGANKHESETKQRQLASKDELFGMFEHLEAELERRDFFQVPDKKANMMMNIRNMLARAEFSGQEVRTMRGIIRCLSERR